MNPALSPRVRIATLVVLAASLLSSGCFEFGAPKKGEPVATVETPLVRAVSPRLRALNRVLEISGTVEALTRSELTPRLSGLTIVSLDADLGDVVAKDQVLCALDSTEAAREVGDSGLAVREAAVRIREADTTLGELKAQQRGQASLIAQAEKGLDRAKAQAEKGALAAELLENAHYKLAQEVSMNERLGFQIQRAEVAVEIAKKAEEKAVLARNKAEQTLAWTTVRAPFAGVVAKRSARVGQIAQSGAPLFELFDPASLAVASQITQRDLPFVKAGQDVEIRSDAYPTEAFRGSVATISPVVDETAGTIPLRISIDDPSRLKPGLFIAGRIVLERRENALTLPKKSVLYERERPFVFKIEAGDKPDSLRVRRLFFREGLSDREDVEALFEKAEDAPTEADRIVLVGQDRLRDGDPIALESEAASRVATPKSAGKNAGSGG